MSTLGLQGLNQEEKARHALRLTETVEKKRQTASKCWTSQDQVQNAAMHRQERKKKNVTGDAGSLTADLASQLLWSRKYQPSSLSEVTCVFLVVFFLYNKSIVSFV